MSLDFIRNENGRFAGGDTPNIQVLNNPESIAEAAARRNTPFAIFIHIVTQNLCQQNVRYVTYEDIAQEANKQMGLNWVKRETIHNIVHSTVNIPTYERKFAAYKIVAEQDIKSSSIATLLEHEDYLTERSKRTVLMSNLIHPKNEFFRAAILNALTINGHIESCIMPSNFALGKQRAEVVHRLLCGFDDCVVSQFRHLDLEVARYYLTSNSTEEITAKINASMLKSYSEYGIDTDIHKCIQYDDKTTVMYLDLLLGFKIKTNGGSAES